MVSPKDTEGFSMRFLLILLLPGLAWADIYKCEVDGQTVFTDQPCSDEPHEVRYMEPSGDTASIDAMIARNNGDMERRAIQAEIRRLERETYLRLNDLDKQISNLKRERSYANNNLAGATYAAGIDQRLAALQESRTRVEVEAERREDELRRKLTAFPD